MRRPRWLASIGVLALAVSGLVTIGAGPGAAVLTATVVSGTVVLPASVEASQVFLDAIDPSGEYLSGSGVESDGSFELALDISVPTSFTLQLGYYAPNAYLSGWVYYPGETAVLGTKAQATAIHVSPGVDSELDPIHVNELAQLTVTASGPTGQQLADEEAWGFELVDPASGEQASAGLLGTQIGAFSGFSQVVGVNRNSGFSRYTGRYYAGDGALGSPGAAGATSVTFVAGGTAAIDVRLDTCGTVSGTVSGGQDLTSPWVTIFNDDDPALVTRQALVEADGTFEVSGLLPGEYWAAPTGWTESHAEWVEGAFYQDADPAAGDPAPLTIASCSTHLTGIELSLPEASGVVPVIPERVKDDAAVAPGAPRCVQVAGVGSVPAEASGVVLNVTTDRPSGGGYVVVYPDTAGNGATPPPAGSTVNFEPGQAVANSAFVQLPADGKVCYYTAGASAVRVVLDVTSYLMPDAGVSTQASQRLLDTRGGSYHVGTITGPVAPRVVKTVQVTGQAGVPTGASAVLLNVTVVGATGAGNLRVFPGGQAVPNASVINYAPGQTKASATIVSLPADGTVSFYSDSGAPVDVILDVVGSVATGGAYHAITPTRVIDTRPTSLIGDLVGPLAGREWHESHLEAVPVIPAEATAVVLNVTAIGPTGQGNLRVFPSSASTEVPNASTLNYIPGRDIPNLVVVGLEPWAWVTFWSDTSGTVNLAVDVVGYIAPILPG